MKIEYVGMTYLSASLSPMALAEKEMPSFQPFATQQNLLFQLLIIIEPNYCDIRTLANQCRDDVKGGWRIPELSLWVF